MRRVHVIVRGTVQGVGYRYAARTAAQEAGLTGWVRNRRDGSVEAELEGGADDVDRMLSWMRQGPPAAAVEDAQIREVPPIGGAAFDVLPNGTRFPD